MVQKKMPKKKKNPNRGQTSEELGTRGTGLTRDTDSNRRHVAERTDELSNWKAQASTQDTGGEEKKSEIKEMKSKHDT